jgi:predicted MFS family arabinose efflux permease
MLTAGQSSPPARLPSLRRVPSGLVLWSSAVFALQIGVARLGYGLALPAIRTTLHGDYTLYGTINAASLGGYLAGALIAPLAMRVRQVVLWSSIVAGAALVISGFAGDQLVFGAARTLFGFASGISLVAAAVQTLESVDAAKRGGASAVMWGGIGIGMVLSALGADWLLRGLDWRIASLGTGVLTALVGIGYGVAARREATSALAPQAAAQQPLPLRRFGLLCLAYFSFGFAYIAYATFIVASIDARLGVRGGQATIELLWALYGIASVIGAIAIGRILHRPIGRGALVFAGLAGAAGCAVASVVPVAAVASAFLVGLGLTATPTAATAFARARSTPSTAAVAIAAVTVAVGIGQLIGPVAAGIAADRLGLNSVVLVAFAVYTLGVIFSAADAVIAEH